MSAVGDSPYDNTRAEVRERMAITRSSSAFRTATPNDGNASTSSPLARATPSRPPTRLVCASPTRVTTPMAGRAIRQSRSIWPNPRIPISRTSTSVSIGALRIVTGNPCSLLYERSDATVRLVLEMAAATKSFVVVLPTEPVMPTAMVPAGRRMRAQRAASMSASPVSATSMHAMRSTRSARAGRDDRYATAPRAMASSTKS